MTGSLVRVWTDVGARKPAALLAKIIEKDGVILTIKYLTESNTDHIWRYENDAYEIDDDSIAEYLNTDSELDLGFIPRDDGFTRIDSDEDYVPSDEDSDDTDSLEDSDEETTDEEIDEDSDLEDDEDLEDDSDDESNIDEE